MSNLTDLIQIIPPDNADEPEDIFSSASVLLFPDDFRALHGDPGSTIVYKSVKFGNIELQTADPTGEDERKLFSHYLWNSGIKVAELVSQDDNEKWSIEHKCVLVLGAGVGLEGIVAVLAGAKRVVMSDYPSPTVLANIRRNAQHAIPPSLSSTYSIEGHEWGDLCSNFATSYAHQFDCVLAADCTWMPTQHLNLVRSMLHFLTMEPEGRVFVVTAFHTGRATLSAFFVIAEEHGLHAEDIYEENVKGVRREWASHGDGASDGPATLKNWLVVAILKRKA